MLYLQPRPRRRLLRNFDISLQYPSGVRARSFRAQNGLEREIHHTDVGTWCTVLAKSTGRERLGASPSPRPARVVDSSSSSVEI